MLKDEATGEIYVGEVGNGKWLNISEEDYEDGKIDNAEDSWKE